MLAAAARCASCFRLLLAREELAAVLQKKEGTLACGCGASTAASPGENVLSLMQRWVFPECLVRHTFVTGLTLQNRKQTHTGISRCPGVGGGGIAPASLL